MFRSVLSVFLGFVLMMILTMTFFAVLFSIFPDSFPSLEEAEAGAPGTMSFGINCVVLVLDLLSAAFAGYFTAAVAGRKPLEHAGALALLVGTMGLVTLFTMFGDEPIWYQLSRLFGAPVAVAAGGYFRTWQYAEKVPPSSP